LKTEKKRLHIFCSKRNNCGKRPGGISVAGPLGRASSSSQRFSKGTSTNLKTSDFEVPMALSRKAARSERATKEAAPRPPANIKRITLDLPEELHRAIKLNAIKEGVTMAQKLRALLMEHYAPTEPKNEA
jgi:hypothetical protein